MFIPGQNILLTKLRWFRPWKRTEFHAPRKVSSFRSKQDTFRKIMQVELWDALSRIAHVVFGPRGHKITLHPEKQCEERRLAWQQNTWRQLKVQWRWARVFPKSIHVYPWQKKCLTKLRRFRPWTGTEFLAPSVFVQVKARYISENHASRALRCFKQNCARCLWSKGTQNHPSPWEAVRRKTVGVAAEYLKATESTVAVGTSFPQVYISMWISGKKSGFDKLRWFGPRMSIKFQWFRSCYSLKANSSTLPERVK